MATWHSLLHACSISNTVPHFCAVINAAIVGVGVVSGNQTFGLTLAWRCLKLTIEVWIIKVGVCHLGNIFISDVRCSKYGIIGRACP